MSGFRRSRRDFGVHLMTMRRSQMTGTDDRAFGADDVAATSILGRKFKKLRLLMTDNTLRIRLCTNSWRRVDLRNGRRPSL
jgi:hypothetical protein